MMSPKDVLLCVLAVFTLVAADSNWIPWWFLVLVGASWAVLYAVSVMQRRRRRCGCR